MSQNWTIMIKGSPASFDPDVYGTDPGQPLKAQLGDLICWNNQTSEQHRLAVTKDGTTTFTTKDIEGFKSSSPGYVPQATDVGADGTIAYHCTLHDGEEGTITVVKS